MPENNSSVTRCVSWIAVSSERQGRKGVSLPDQQAKARQFIEKMPDLYRKIGSIIEEIEIQDSRSIIELSVAMEHHHQYRRLIELIKAKAFDALIIYKIDRLARHQALIITIYGLCTEAGIPIIETGGSLPATLTVTENVGEIYRQVVGAAGARGELLNMRDRRRMGMRSRLEKGQFFAGECPYGYMYAWSSVGIKRVEIVPEEAAAVRHALLTLYLDNGFGAPRIADEMNAAPGMAAPAKGERWDDGAIRNLIESVERYAGIIEHWRDQPELYLRVEAAGIPKILSLDEVRRVVAERIERGRTAPRQRHTLSSILICVKCESTLRYNTAIRTRLDGSQWKRRYLTCVAPGCPDRNRKIAEEVLINKLRLMLVELAETTDFSGYVTNPVDSRQQLEGEEKAVLARQRQLERGRTNLAQARFVNETMGELQYLELLQGVEDELRALDKKLIAIRSKIADAQTEQDQLDRLIVAQRDGVNMIALAEVEPELVNQWLRKFVRLWVDLRAPRPEAIKNAHFL